MPDYPPTGKRTLQDNGSWLRTLTRDNVELVRTGIDHIEPDAIVTVDGERHEADVIVYATGFHATKVLFPMDIVGRDGVDLRAMWGERPAAYLGITVPGVPEPVLHVRAGHQPRARRQPDLPLRVPDALHHPVHRGADRRRAPHDGAAPGAVRRLARAVAGRDQDLVWSQPSIKHSFFKNAYGEIHGLSPWRLVDYWAWTKEPDLADFVIS